MALQETEELDDEQGGGAPMWMVTYGDSITLLLTFFVMLLTFSTPNKEGMAKLSRGFMAGSRRLSLMPGPGDQENVVSVERRLTESRLDENGAETPPMAKEEPLNELKKHFESIDVNQLKDLKGGRVIRIPVVELFGTGQSLTADGRQVLDNVASILRAGRYSVVVHLEAAGGPDVQARRDRSLRMGLQVSECLAAGAGSACEDVGLSDNVNLLGSPAAPGTCEIVVLEV